MGRLIILFLLAFFAGVARADDGRTLVKELTFATRYSLHSDLLGEDVQYQVALPDGYPDKNLSQTYPVIYVLDGGYYQTLLTYGIAVTRYGLGLKMPQVLIVGIPSNNRRRDYTPTPITSTPWQEGASYMKDAGGADAYRTFLREEFFPHIEANYRTNGHRILIGHSYGGLFALHDLLSEKPMFQSYIAIDPTLWYDDRLLTRRLQAMEAEGLALRGRLYINQAMRGMAEDNERAHPMNRAQVATFDEFLSVLDAKKTDRLAVTLDRRTWDDHVSSFTPGILEGLDYVFEGYLPMQDAEAGYTALSGDVYQAIAKDPNILVEHYKSYSACVGVSYAPEERFIGGSAATAMREGLTENALTLYEMGTKYYPDYVPTWVRIGDFHKAQGDMAKARTAYGRALTLDPENEWAKGKLKALDAETQDQP